MRKGFYKGTSGYLRPDLIRAIQDEYKAEFGEHINRHQVNLVIRVMFETIKTMLCHEREVKICGFGKFTTDDFFTGKKTKKRIRLKMTDQFETLFLKEKDTPII
jgi:nucleoid DNA-binding protein